MATLRFRKKRWQVQIRRRGHSPLTKSFALKRDAERWAFQTEAKLERGEVPNFPPTYLKDTLRELVVRYRDTVSLRKKGHDIERVILNAFLRQSICELPAGRLSSADFAAYRDLRLKTVHVSTLRREFSILHHLFQLARDEWGIKLPSNPLTGLRLGKAAPPRERRLRQGEEEALMVSASRCRSKLMKPAIELAIQTGMRRGELLQLRWTHVDRENRSLLIADSKNGRARHIPLTLAALRVLEALPPHTERLFPMSPNAFRLAWERIRRRAKLPDLHFHDLRHEAISRFFERGLTVPEIASISGHRDVRMILRYAHPMRNRLLEVLDRSEPVLEAS